MNDPEQNLHIFKRIVDHVPALVAYWDAQARNVAASAAYGEWFGVDPEKMRGTHISEVLGEANYALNIEFIEAVLRGESQQFDRALRDPLGRVHHTQTSYVPDTVGEAVVGFFVLVADVSARVQAERSTARALHQYQALLQSIPDAFVVLFDDELKVLFAEGSGLEHFGLSDIDVVGMDLLEVSPEHVLEVEKYYRDALRGETSHWTRAVNGRFYSFIAAPVRSDDDHPFAGMVVGRDITEQRRLEITGTALHQLALAAARRAPLEEIVGLVSHSILDLFGAQYAAVTRFDPEGIRILSFAPLDHLQGTFLQEADHTATGIVARTGLAQVVVREAGAPRIGTFSQMAIGSSAAAPIYVGAKLWGSIAVASEANFADSRATMEVLQSFADVVSLAISNNEAWDELDHQARRDPLTALANRRVFEETLEYEIHRAARAHVPLAVALIDLDHFKKVNDTYGHPVGDDVLVEVASRLRESARRGELVARLGGEEFAVVLFDCAPAKLEAACERFRQCIARDVFASGIHVTASVGAATRLEPMDPSELVRLADVALYAAKNAGRNQVILDVLPLEKAE